MLRLPKDSMFRGTHFLTCGSNLRMLEPGDVEGSLTVTNFKFVVLRIMLYEGFKICSVALQKTKITIKVDTSY